jgi:hypothetical protein
MTWKARAERYGARGEVELLIGKKVGDSFDHLTNIEFERMELGQVYSSSSPIHGDEAISFMQSVMDAAYEYGLRPSAAQDERHIKDHLKDMREISRHLLKMDKG